MSKPNRKTWHGKNKKAKANKARAHVEYVKHMKTRHEVMGEIMTAHISKMRRIRARANANNPFVSDHAVMRFMERFMGFDIEAVREKMLSEGVKAAIKANGMNFSVDGVTYIVQDGIIVTVHEGTPSVAYKQVKSKWIEEGEQ